MKKALAFLILFVLVFCASSVVLAEKEREQTKYLDEEHQIMFIILKNKTAEIVDCRAEGELTIPAKISGYCIDDSDKTVKKIPVSRIGEDAFINSRVTKVKINCKLTEIGKNAFNGCESLTSIKLPD